jgi:hypothetical protein
MNGFIIQELVDPTIFKTLGESAWQLLNPSALQFLADVRDVFGPILVNNWHVNGSYSESGLRRFDTTTGAKFSQHKYGNAFDMKSKGATPQEMHAYILANPSRFPTIRVLERIESTPTWVHADCRNTRQAGIVLVSP